ncbi:S66 peptidase family protein [Sphingobium aquiterrae]|uniref:S66 peptidase family protein n=1 Tax=Sphingobium aquiterrae TaxID=2038656 RepID=UPI003AFB41CA
MIDRRDAMAAALVTLSGLAAAMALPLDALTAASPPRTVRKSPRLRPGDMVGLIEPAGFTNDAFDLAMLSDSIRAMGLVPKPAPHLMARYGYLAGEDKARAADVNAMFADKDVRAIFAVRGGWGCARILPLLDWDVIRANPKLLIGFSDITALHLAIAAKAGFTTIHGPNAASSWGRLSWDSFRALAFDAGTPLYSPSPLVEDRLAPRNGIRTFRPGKASGRLLGGNLTVLSALVGTPWLPDFDGAILFIEDTDEAEYRIDRMLTQLTLAGILGKVAGVAFGQCTDCKAVGGSNYGGFTLSQVLDQHLAPLGVPAFQGAMFGHVANQISLPMGIPAEIDAAAGTIRILEPAVV